MTICISPWSSLVRSAVTSHLNPHLNPRLCPALRSIHHCATVLGPVNQNASERLFADAAREESGEESTSKSTQLESQHQNWTGKESMQDAILRMLVDKYKPLRFGLIRTADQKLQESPPQIRQSAVSAQAAVPTPARPWQEIADAPLLPSIEGHRPWHTTFKAPSHAAASIKLGNIAPSSARSSTGSDDSYESTKRTERELEKRKQQARRLSHARESTLDYRLGLRDGGAGNRQTSSRINPVSLKGWQSLIEDRVEKARLSGQFGAVNAFRETLRQSWTKRAIRTLTITQPAPFLPSLSASTVTSLRDREWEEREHSYHDTAIAELNSLVRKYNAMAPYAVRRPYYTRDTELARAYHDCGEEILRGIHDRSRTPLRFEPRWHSIDDGPRRVGTFLSLWDFILQWLRALSKRFTKAS